VETLLHIGLSNMVVATVLALVAATISCICRRPALAHGLWLLVLLKLVTPPLAPLPIAWRPAPEPVMAEPTPPSREAVVDEPQLAPPAGDFAIALPPEEPRAVPAAAPQIGPAASAESRPDRPDPEQPASPRPQPASTAPPGAEGTWSRIAAALWLAGAVFWLAVAGLRIGRFQRLLAHARPVPDDIQREAERLAERLGLAYCPRVGLVAGAVSPMLWSLAGPAQLLLPAGLLGRLSTEQHRTLLAHELAHLRRRDHWVRNLELLVTALYWWFPLVWWARRELHEAEEQCCDAWVVWALPDSARAYALAIMTTIDFLSGVRAAVPVAASGIGPVHSLRRRLTMIMRGGTPRALSLAGFLAVVGLGALALPWQPTQAQDEPPRKLQDGDERPGARRGDDVDRSRREVERLNDQIRRLHDQMEAAESRLRQAQRQLAQAAGAQPRAERGRADAAPRVEPPPALPRTPGMGGPPGMVPGRRGMGGGGGRQAPDRDLDGRLREIEWKLDALLRQMDDLRRELRGGRPGDRLGDAPRFGGATPPPVSELPRGGSSPRPPEPPAPGSRAVPPPPAPTPPAPARR
jgi:beta-lactamase regulating signal transducer with metallopeptidase domain